MVLSLIYDGYQYSYYLMLTLMAFTINIDWLQVYCHVTQLTSFGDLGAYHIKQLDYSTNVYNRVYSVTKLIGSTYLPIAIITAYPKSRALNQNSCHIKLDNQILYTQDVFNELKSLIQTYHLDYQSISRIDIAYDCNRYANRWTPLRLLQDYVAGKVLKIGNNSPVVNYKSMGYLIGNQTKTDNIDLKRTKPRINAITWGSHSSGVQLQIYDKSYELRTQHYKQWIVDAWTRAGLDVDNVWRTELRIQGGGKSLLNIFSGTLYEVGIDHIIDDDAISTLFFDYAHKYCRFVLTDYHVHKQQMKKIQQFNQSETVDRPKYKRYCRVGTRTVKVVANWINRLADDISHARLSLDTVIRDNVAYALETLSSVYNQHYSALATITPIDYNRLLYRQHSRDLLSLS